jgi:hypothetical protein
MVLSPFMEPTNTNLASSSSSSSSSPLPPFDPADPTVVFDNPAAIQPRVAEAATHMLSLRDDGRAALRLNPSPRGALMAVVDGLGRVLLLEGSSPFGLLRMWKVCA